MPQQDYAGKRPISQRDTASPLAAFDAADVGTVEIGHLGQLFLGPATLLAQSADVAADDQLDVVCHSPIIPAAPHRATP